MSNILKKHYKKIGSRGGKALLAKRGVEYFKELNKKSVAKRRLMKLNKC